MKKAPEKDASLREAALRAMENAYAPYSNFRVGAALRARDGQLITGCNMKTRLTASQFARKPLPLLMLSHKG